MNVYVDTSALLGILFGEPRRLRIWSRITSAVASELIAVECLRTIDRARIRLALPDSEVELRRSMVLEAVESFRLVPVGPSILRRAAGAFPTPLGTLDAIHLASALWARVRVEDLSFATHDQELAAAARALGFAVYGAPR